MGTTTCKYIMNPEFIINIFILEVHIIFQVYVIIINVFNCMLDTNIYEYADVLECEYADIHKYEYANVYKYELVETQKIEKQKRKKKTFSSTCGACVAGTLVPGRLTGTKWRPT